ncbi:hypothetical protein HPB51_023455 [Rhipicephalus microplus]|uniref:Uncharacterized protein n=1 Tax=Rhipicephalus microplus TaxID=6941 RepID=A0A9J6F9A5_RHIMP|nr:hypothetical protein HPB51_023455 [Rhipicephalus microplus]
MPRCCCQKAAVSPIKKRLCRHHPPRQPHRQETEKTGGIAVSFLSWSPRTRPTMLQPDLERRMEEQFSKVKTRVDERRGSERAYKEGESVPVQGLRPGDPKWLIGVIERRSSAVTYLVRVGSEDRFMHVENLRPRYFESGEEGPSERLCFAPSSIPDPESEAPPTSPRPLPVRASSRSATAPPEQPGDSAPSEQPIASPHQGSAPATSPLRIPASPLGAQIL